MKYNSLSNLIDALEYGTRLHISVFFISNHGNIKTNLPIRQKFHTAQVCQAEKASTAGYAACVRCRNAVLKMAVRHKRSFGGCCVKGIYEYCRPVLYNGEVACVVFIGNILPQEAERQLALRQRLGDELVNTLESDFSEDRCVQVADLLETYILHLLQSYRGSEDATYDPLLENIKGYIGDNLRYGFFMPELAEVFNYNEKYIVKVSVMYWAKPGSSGQNRTSFPFASTVLVQSSMSLSTRGQCPRIAWTSMPARTGDPDSSALNFSKLSTCRRTFSMAGRPSGWSVSE